MNTPQLSDVPVLIVDDVEANLVALQALLEGLGCRVHLARSGNDALRQLLKNRYAVVLLDVQMPGMDGYEVARIVRQNPSTREVPLIFLTAQRNTEDKLLRGYGSGVVDYLFKPVEPNILRSKVRVFMELFAGRRLLDAANQNLEAKNAELRELAEAKSLLAEGFRAANENLSQAYRDLQTTQAQLVQSAKMASLGELVAGVAHEINNPLSFLLSHLDTARLSLSRVLSEIPGGLPGAAREPWERAETRMQEMALGLERIRELVLKLRTFSRIDEGELKTVSIRECIESVLTILAHRAGQRVEIETYFGEPDQVECFPSLLNQAILNLVANAIDAIADSGTVSICTGAQGNEYRITVADTGHGIPLAIRDRVLDPFFTTKPVGQGTGLGLAITDSIVRKHRGRLTFGDRPGQGTEVVLGFPLPLLSEG